MATKVFAYIRLSKWDDSSTSPQRQKARITKLCKERRWQIVDWFTDIDQSAWNGRHRPGLEAMMSRLSEVGAIVFWKWDRLARSVEQGGQIAQSCRDAGVDLVATDDAEIDTTTASGKLVYNILISVAQNSSDMTSDRARSMVEWKKERGEPLGRVPYGWKRVGKHYEKDAAQQAVLREAAERFVGGESATAVASGLGFIPKSLSRMLASQRVQDELPAELRADLVRALLDRHQERAPTSERSLLGGIVKCSICQKGLRRCSTRARDKGDPWYIYACHATGHVSISGAWLESFVIGELLSRVDPRAALKAVQQQKTKGGTRKVTEVEARIELLHAEFAAGRVSMAQYKKTNALLFEQLAKAQESERRAGFDLRAEEIEVLNTILEPGGRGWGRWDDLLTRAQQRRIVSAFISKLTVDKATGHGRVDPGRVHIEWRR